MEPRIGMAVGLIFARCFGGPPDGGGHGGHGAKGGSAGSGAVAGTAGVSSGGTAGHGGDAGGAPSEAGHGGLPAAAGEGGVPSGEGGAAGGEGGDTAEAGGFGGAGVAGSPSGGQGGEGEMACDIDLLPVQAFANASWSESTYCLPGPGGSPCPTTFPPIIVDGELRFSSAGRPGGAAWTQTVSTTLTVPAGTHTLTTYIPRVSCDFAQASVSGTFNGAMFENFIPIPPSSSPTTGVFSIRFTQTSGPPCSYTLSDVSVRAHRC